MLDFVIPLLLLIILFLRFDGNIAADLELEAKWLDMINGMVANMTVTARSLKSRVVQLEENSKFNHSSMRDAVKSLISQADR